MRLAEHMPGTRPGVDEPPHPCQAGQRLNRGRETLDSRQNRGTAGKDKCPKDSTHDAQRETVRPSSKNTRRGSEEPDRAVLAWDDHTHTNLRAAANAEAEPLRQMRVLCLRRRGAKTTDCSEEEMLAGLAARREMLLSSLLSANVLTAHPAKCGTQDTRGKPHPERHGGADRQDRRRRSARQSPTTQQSAARKTRVESRIQKDRRRRSARQSRNDCKSAFLTANRHS